MMGTDIAHSHQVSQEGRQNFLINAVMSRYGAAHLAPSIFIPAGESAKRHDLRGSPNRAIPKGIRIFTPGILFIVLLQPIQIMAVILGEQLCIEVRKSADPTNISHVMNPLSTQRHFDVVASIKLRRRWSKSYRSTTAVNVTPSWKVRASLPLDLLSNGSQ